MIKEVNGNMVKHKVKNLIYKKQDGDQSVLKSV
jgi:hypothetical protein